MIAFDRPMPPSAPLPEPRRKVARELALPLLAHVLHDEVDGVVVDGAWEPFAPDGTRVVVVECWV